MVSNFLNGLNGVGGEEGRERKEYLWTGAYKISWDSLHVSRTVEKYLMEVVYREGDIDKKWVGIIKFCGEER